MKRRIAMMMTLLLLLTVIMPAYALGNPTVVVKLDGLIVHPERYGDEATKALIIDDRTMVPVRFLSEALGADITWQALSKTIIIWRANTSVRMQIGNKLAMVDDKSVEMDVAPVIVAGRTYIPARYISEFFNQDVNWVQSTYTVEVIQDKSVAVDSNLEQWSLAMAAMLNFVNSGSNLDMRLNRDAPLIYGGGPRWIDNDKTMARSARKALRDYWNINNRNELIATIETMDETGHHVAFQKLAAKIKAGNLKPADASAKRVRATELISAKWGDRGIMCWDAFRSANLAQWGYLAGYLKYGESLELTEPAIKRVRESFISWDDAYENYLDGYYWWADQWSDDQQIWQSERGKFYNAMKNDPEIGELFNSEMFSEDVKGLQ